VDAATREVPRHDWIEFLDSFSRQHRGWLVTIEVLGRDIGAQIESRDQPLTGISADLRGSTDDAISVFVGTGSGDHVAHIVRSPSHVRVKETSEGAHEALQIEAANGETTLVRFRSAVLPEQVDGVVVNL
jgi:hypothetical protein